MRTTLLVASLALFLIPAASGQTLAHSSPSDVLLYFRGVDPLKTFQKAAGNKLIWDNPVDIERDFLAGLDKAMGEAGNFLGFEAGSLTTYLRSVTSWEAVVYRFELTDGFPEFEFAMALTTPMADQIYQLLSGEMVKRKFGEMNKDGELTMDFDGQFGLSVAQKDQRIIFANDQRRLRRTFEEFGKVIPDCLAQSARYKDAVEGDVDQCFYMRTDTLITMAREEWLPRMRGAPRGMVQTATRIMESMGLFKLTALGYTENDRRSRLAILANGDMPIFDILSTDNGNPELLHMMPADTAFGFVWCGDTVNLWKKGSAFFLDQTKFPMAKMAEAGVREFQKMSGVKAEELATLASGGMGFGFIPDADGRLDDNPRYVFGFMKSAEPAKLKELVSTLTTSMSERHGIDFEIKEEGDAIWYMPSKGDDEKRRSNRAGFAIVEDTVIAGTPDNIKKILSIRSGQHPSLSSVHSSKGLKPGAAAYFFVGLKTLMGQENEFSNAYSQMRDGAGIAGAIEIKPDRLVMTTNLPIGETMNAFMMGMVGYEVQSDGRRAAMEDLGEIAKAYRVYRGKHNRSPTNLADLGFEGEKALTFKGKASASEPAKPYVLLQVGEVPEGEEHRIIIAHTPDATLGRLVATLNGSTYGLSEPEFRSRMRRQQADFPATVPVEK